MLCDALPQSLAREYENSLKDILVVAVLLGLLRQEPSAISAFQRNEPSSGYEHKIAPLAYTVWRGEVDLSPLKLHPHLDIGAIHRHEAPVKSDAKSGKNGPYFIEETIDLLVGLYAASDSTDLEADEFCAAAD
jgi:hypothetical protein